MKLQQGHGIPTKQYRMSSGKDNSELLSSYTGSTWAALQVCRTGVWLGGFGLGPPDPPLPQGRTWLGEYRAIRTPISSPSPWLEPSGPHAPPRDRKAQPRSSFSYSWREWESSFPMSIQGKEGTRQPSIYIYLYFIMAVIPSKTPSKKIGETFSRKKTNPLQTSQHGSLDHQKNRNSQTPSPTQNWPHEVPLLQAPGPTQVGVIFTPPGVKKQRRGYWEWRFTTTTLPETNIVHENPHLSL